MPDDFLPIAQPDLDDDDVAEVVDTLRSGWLVYGPKTQRLEREFAEMVGAEYALGVNSCTAGLHLSLLAAGVGPGDEVITTPLTFAATANVILHAGATPVLADICADDLNIDPEQIERRITPRTRALIPVHYAGIPCRMDEILDIARRHNLTVIEDAATAAGSGYRERMVGNIGDLTAFSFYPVKNMTTGQGGMVTTNDKALADQIVALRNHGLDSNAWNRYSSEANRLFYTMSAPGFNYGMFDLLASIGLGQLRRLPEFNEKRRVLAGHYTRAFAGLPQIETPAVRDDVTSNWHLYVIRLRDAKVTRAELAAGLKERGIGTSVHYYPIHYHPYYRERFGFQGGDYPVCEAEFERILSLPLFPRMNEADVERVVSAVGEIVG
ncbi:MAG TPA: DegT/DnrJ/EryC1/StrS family aminotransferase [Dehalococcoidia bacterium]|nr:DegT/DnrJ/EryC1/StrS family aminotransferase [Dehalococcoidia bacterium]